jgi:hypothetical protein
MHSVHRQALIAFFSAALGLLERRFARTLLPTARAESLIVVPTNPRAAPQRDRRAGRRRQGRR